MPDAKSNHRNRNDLGRQSVKYVGQKLNLVINDPPFPIERSPDDFNDEQKRNQWSDQVFDTLQTLKGIIISVMNNL
jgi:hypothetical protein